MAVECVLDANEYNLAGEKVVLNTLPKVMALK